MKEKKITTPEQEVSVSEPPAPAESVAGAPDGEAAAAQESESSSEAAPAEPSPAPIYIALRHIIRSGKDYFAGDVVDFTPHVSRWIHTETGSVPDMESEADLAAHIAELKATGTIKEA